MAKRSPHTIETGAFEPLELRPLISEGQVRLRSVHRLHVERKPG